MGERERDKAFPFYLSLFFLFFLSSSKFEHKLEGNPLGGKKKRSKFDIKFLEAATSDHTALKISDY